MMKSDWTIDSVISALLLIKEEKGNLPVELLEDTKYGALPKEGFEINIVRMDGRTFVDLSDIWKEV